MAEMTVEKTVETKAAKTAGSLVCMTVRRMEILLAVYLGKRSAVLMVDGSDLKMAYTTAVY